MKKHDEKLNRKKINFINFISILIGFSQAVLIYVISSYFKAAIGTENVGIFYFGTSIVALVLLLNLHKIVKSIGKSNSLFLILGVKLIALFFLVMLKPGISSIVFLLVYMMFVPLDTVAIDIILESYSVDKLSGRIRGLEIIALESGYVLGPFLSTNILNKYGFHYVFFAALIIVVFVFSLALLKLGQVNHKFNKKLSTKALLKKVLKRPNIMRIYSVSIVLELFFAIMVIFSPIYLRDIGFSWSQIGIIFTFMLVPFLIMPYPIGYLADKKLGEKELLIAALFVMGIATLSVFFTTVPSLKLWILILVFTRIGASSLQTLRDSYFYKRIDGHDVDLNNFFRTANPIAYLFGSALSFFILLFYPVRVLFFALALIIFLSLYPAFRLIDNKCEDELIAEGKLIE